MSEDKPSALPIENISDYVIQKVNPEKAPIILACCVLKNNIVVL